LPFDVAVTNVTGSGTSRTVTAQVTNKDTKDVHNARAKVEGLCQGSKLKVCGMDCVVEEIGTIKAGETISKQAKIQLGLFDCMKVARSGAQIVVTITSDESNQTFNFELHP
jgi:hypothetical protein